MQGRREVSEIIRVVGAVWNLTSAINRPSRAANLLGGDTGSNGRWSWAANSSWMKFPSAPESMSTFTGRESLPQRMQNGMVRQVEELETEEAWLTSVLPLAGELSLLTSWDMKPGNDPSGHGRGIAVG